MEKNKSNITRMVNKHAFVENSTRFYNKQYNTNVPLIKSAACIIL